MPETQTTTRWRSVCQTELRTIPQILTSVGEWGTKESAIRDMRWCRFTVESTGWKMWIESEDGQRINEHETQT